MSDATKRLLTILIVLVAMVLFLNWARGNDGRTYYGTAEWIGEQSKFYLNGKCSASPWWMSSEAEGTYEIRKRWEDLGRPAAVKVVFVGDVTKIGRWGQNGKFWREVSPRQVIEVLPLPGACE
jgi:hypothetical protein